MLATIRQLDGRTMITWFLNVLVMGLAVGVISSVIFIKWFQGPLTTLTIPVFITGQDNQGGQFALGVSRAVNWAERFKLDEVDGRKVRPLFLNEDSIECLEGQVNCSEEANKEELLNSIRTIRRNVPVVVGPLTSTHAGKLIPSIAKDMRIPMVLGIPTNSELSSEFAGRVWRLSPTDSFQAEAVSKTLESLAGGEENSMIVGDFSGANDKYSKFLTEVIASKAAESTILGKQPQTFELTRTNLGDFDQKFKDWAPDIIIYAGMPEQAKLVLRTVFNQRDKMVFIFTDGCVDLEFIDILKDYAAARPKSRFFITFQAPPPSLSKGIRSYIWFTQSMGGHVTGVVDQVCRAKSAAMSYEVFGFDSYMIALNLLHEATEATGAGVEEAMGNRSPQWPFLLMSPYQFDQRGNNTELQFHVYEVRGDGCPFHSGGEDGSDDICPNDSRLGE